MGRPDKNDFNHPYAVGDEHITKITVHWKTAIDGIEIETDAGGHSLVCGNAKGSGKNRADTNHSPFTLQPGQVIIKVSVKVGSWNDHIVITGIHFVLRDKDGKLSDQEFGEKASQTLGHNDGYEVCGFWGYSKTVLDSLGTIERKIK